MDEIEELQKQYPFLRKSYIEYIVQRGRGLRSLRESNVLFSTIYNEFGKLLDELEKEYEKYELSKTFNEDIINKSFRVINRFLPGIEHIRDGLKIYDRDYMYIFNCRYNDIITYTSFFTRPTENVTFDLVIPPQAVLLVYYETNFDNAREEGLITSVDPVSYEHISDYYYKCIGSIPHCFSFSTIFSFCGRGGLDADCTVCPMCKTEMDKRLYKQPKQMFELKEVLYDKVLLDSSGEYYDEERIYIIVELLKDISSDTNESMVKRRGIDG